MLNFQNDLDIDKYSKIIRQKINITELKEAFRDPGLIHLVLCLPKCWYKNSLYSKDTSACREINNCSCLKYYNLWYEYANKTEFYNEIVRTFNN